MSRIYEYHESSYSGDNSINEYLDRINRMHRTPTIINDFPEAHTPHPTNHRVRTFPHNHHPPEAVHKKVHFTEHEKHVEVDNHGKHKVYEEKTIDMEADGFIKKRHRNFESCNTFNGY